MRKVHGAAIQSGCVYALVAILAMATNAASANVKLELRPVQPTAYVGAVLEVGLYAVSDSTDSQMVRGLQAILQWDPAYLELDSGAPVINNGPYAWLMSGFYSDAQMDGLNDTWTDGNAYYQAIGNFQDVAWATPSGLRVATLRFRVLAPALATQITILTAYGLYTHTEVYGEVVGQNVVGSLGTATVLVSAGDLALNLPGPMCGLEPGDSVTVQLTVSGLAEPINGVQALIRFDPDVLGFAGARPGNGSGSPWDAAIEVHEGVQVDTVVYALILVGTGTTANAVVAELTFRFQPSWMPAIDNLTLLAEQPPLASRLTSAATGAAIAPQLGPALTVITRGDLNADGLIDFADFSGFATCMGGPNVSAGAETCCRVDFDVDTDIDLADYRGLQLAQCATYCP